MVVKRIPMPLEGLVERQHRRLVPTTIGVDPRLRMVHPLPMAPRRPVIRVVVVLRIAVRRRTMTRHGSGKGLDPPPMVGVDHVVVDGDGRRNRNRRRLRLEALETRGRRIKDKNRRLVRDSRPLLHRRPLPHGHLRQFHPQVAVITSLHIGANRRLTIP